MRTSKVSFWGGNRLGSEWRGEASEWKLGQPRAAVHALRVSPTRARAEGARHRAETRRRPPCFFFFVGAEGKARRPESARVMISLRGTTAEGKGDVGRERGRTTKLKDERSEVWWPLVDRHTRTPFFFMIVSRKRSVSRRSRLRRHAPLRAALYTTSIMSVARTALWRRRREIVAHTPTRGACVRARAHQEVRASTSGHMIVGERARAGGKARCAAASHGVLLRPLLRRRVVFGNVGLVDPRDLRHERIVRIRIRQQRANA